MKHSIKEVIWGGLIFLIIVGSCIWLAGKDVKASDGWTMVDATAYWDSYGTGRSCTGQPLVEELTLAGRPQDLGKTAYIYDLDKRLIGIYEFRDTGYGQPTGRGRSQVLKGQSLGTIETGQCVDIYMKTYKQCAAWGRRKVYIKIVEAVG